MIRRTARSTRMDALFPYTTRCRSVEQGEDQPRMFEGHHRRGHRNAALLLDLHPVGARAPRLPTRLHLALDMDRAARDEQVLGQRRLARVGEIGSAHV